jgi:hypothetical protein
MKKSVLFFLAGVCIFCSCGKYTEARVKLVALPERTESVIRMDNPYSTLIEEERTLTLQKGVNKVDFSWNGVRIDPDSIRLKIISHPGKVKLLSLSYPPGEPALVWEIFSPFPAEEKIRISYLLSYIDNLVTYKCISDKKEKQLEMSSFLIVRNFSGEDFQNTAINAGYPETFRTSVENEETKQLLLFKKSGIPFMKKLTFDAAQLPWEPDKEANNVGIPMDYVIKNISSSSLGNFPLDAGKVRVFQQDGEGSTIFMGEDKTGFTPVGKEISLRVGESRDIVVTQHKIADRKINIKRNSENKIILYDTDETMKIKIENFKKEKTELTLIEHIPGQWDMEKTSHQYTKKDASTLEFKIQLKPESNEIVTYRYHRRNVK